MEPPPRAQPAPSREPPAARLHGRLALLYLAAGMPLALVLETVPQYLARSGAALADVGRVPGRASLAWTLKFLWAPAVDASRRRRPWILAAQVGLALLLGALAVGVEGAGPAAFAAVVVAMALLSATQDLAADAWTIDRVPRRDLGPANAVRTTGYRVGMALAGGLLAKVAGGFGWPAAWATAAVLYAVFAITTVRLPEAARPKATGPPLLPAIGALARRPRFAAFAAFVLLFKIGDYALAAMAKAFQVRAGLSDDEIGNLALAGIAATVAGVALGGLATKRWGVFRALWVLGLLQAGSNLAYAAAATLGDRQAVYAAATVEQLCGGLGTAPFLSYLMAACDRSHAATQFALLTALMSVGRLLAGEVAGPAVEAHGFATYFLATAALALPAYALLPFVPRDPQGSDAEPETEAPAAP